MYTRIIDSVLKNSNILIIILSIIVGFFAFQAPGLKMDASSDALVLEGDDNLKFYQEVKRSYGTDDYLILSYQVDGMLLSDNQISILKSLKKDLLAVDGVKSITSILDVPLFQSPPISLENLGDDPTTIESGNADIELAKKEFRNSSLYGNNLVSNDGKTTAILINLSPNTKLDRDKMNRNELREAKAKGSISKESMEELKKLEDSVITGTSIKSAKQATIIEKVRSIMDGYRGGAILYLGGLPLITTDIINYISNDLVVFSSAVIVLMTIILAVIFRTMRWVLIPIIVSVTGALVMAGLLSLLDWKITVISSNFFSLLLVMTLSVMIHLIVRYREIAQVDEEKSKNEVIRETMQQMVKPCLYTTLTTVAAFSSLMISGIRPVIDFGWMMSIGVTIALVLSFLTFPMIVSLLPKQNVKKHTTELGFTKKLAKLVDNYGNHILVIVVILMAGSLMGISKLTVENRFIDYFKESTEINKGLTLIDKELGGTIPLEIIFEDLAEDYWYDPELRKEIHEIHNYIESMDETGKVLSIDTFMEILRTANSDKEVGGFFLNIIRNSMPEYAKQQVVNPYISEENGQLRMVIRVKETNKDLKRDELITTINNHINKEFGYNKDNYRLTGMLVLYNDMLQSLFESQIKTVAVVFGIIFIMFLFVFKSVSISILALLSNTLPSMIVLGLMGLMNIPLDLMTITISAIAIGIGVDNAIHYVHRFKTEFKRDQDYRETMHRTHSSIGLAMFYTSITIALGFLTLTLSNFIPSLYFGVLTSLAMMTALLANLTMLPKLIIMFKPKI